MLTTVPTTASKTGKAYLLDFHQINEGDLLLWNDKWYTIQTFERHPDAPSHRQVVAHLYSEAHGWGTAMGQECQTVTVVPRIFKTA